MSGARRFKFLGLAAIAVPEMGCAASNVLDVDSNTVVISTQAAPVCGQLGAQRVAANRAAIETLKRGYDRYVVLDAQAQNNVGVIGDTPGIANTYSSGTVMGNNYGATYSGQSNTYVTGGQPIIAGTHDQQLVIRMFKATDAGAETAVDAKKVLGPKWREMVAKGPQSTC